MKNFEKWTVLLASFLSGALFSAILSGLIGLDNFEKQNLISGNYYMVPLVLGSIMATFLLWPPIALLWNIRFGGDKKMYRKLIEFLKELFILGIQNPGRPGYSIATTAFLDVVENGFFVYVSQMENIAENEPNCSQEVRLNNAGLKMVWSWNIKKHQVYIYICGDQVDYYPEFVEKARELIKKYKFDKEVY